MKTLVYIPCHTDFDLALIQARKVKDDFAMFKNEQNLSGLELEIMIAVNAYIPTVSQLDRANQICEYVIENGIGYSADVNIANGFMRALDLKPDVLWLLSANDDLVSNSIGIVLKEFIADPTLDLIVTSLTLDAKFIEYQVIDPGKTGFSYGLISGVIYNLTRMSPFLHNGPFLAWTGWSQLAVIQNSMDSLNGLNVKAIPYEQVYRQRERSLLEAGKHYAHSVFGMLILGTLLKKDKRSARKFIRKYIFTNFYAWHLFNREWKYSGQLVTSENYLAWNQGIAESLIFKKTPFTFLIYLLARSIPFENFSKLRFVIKIKRKFDLMLGQSKHYKN
jgi:hypothetical protein